MNAPHPSGEDPEVRDPLLSAAGDRLRSGSRPLSADAIAVAVLDRRSRRLSVSLAASLVVILAIAAASIAVRGDDGGANDLASNAKPVTAGQRGPVEDLVARLAKKQPVDPRTVELVSSVEPDTSRLPMSAMAETLPGSTPVTPTGAVDCPRTTNPLPTICCEMASTPSMA